MALLHKSRNFSRSEQYAVNVALVPKGSFCFLSLDSNFYLAALRIEHHHAVGAIFPTADDELFVIELADHWPDDRLDG